VEKQTIQGSIKRNARAEIHSCLARSELQDFEYASYTSVSIEALMSRERDARGSTDELSDRSLFQLAPPSKEQRSMPFHGLADKLRFVTFFINGNNPL
jgi:hypothetical protein